MRVLSVVVSKMSISLLKKLWEGEKEEYKLKEKGTGIQNFVKKFLESENLLNLKEGKLKTKREKRKNEFIHEKGTKERRRADFVIYINSEIEIPIEVECYTHIQRGIKQLKKYQKDLEKKYGILTDGDYWWFYNNENIEKKFNLDEIFVNPSLFLTFWKEYIKPSHYYLAFFGEKAESLKELPIESNKKSFFDDTTFLIKNFKNKLQIEGYFKDLEPKERNKKATQLAYSYLMQFLLYKTLVDNDFGDFLKEYRNILNLISKHITENRLVDIYRTIEGISAKISENIYKPFHEEQKLIEEKIKKGIYHKPELKLSDISLWLDIFVYIKKYNLRNIQNEIFGFIYENYLKELFEEEEKGQYFTDPSVVNFMINEIGYAPKKIKEKIENNQEDKLSIIDPACGSGTFLYTATDSIAHAFSDGLRASKKIEELVLNNIFGLDIEEFPLYLAEMSILMRLLPLIISEKYNNPFDKKIKLFLTKDSISEFLNVKIDNAETGLAIKDGQTNLLYFLKPEHKSFMRDKKDLEEMKKNLISYPGLPRKRFDYVIANPPYISYNICCKQNLLITQLIKKKVVQMSDIYGVNLNTVPGHIKAYAPKPNLYAFFIALGLALLKKGGKLCYIIPQTILTATDLDVLRYHLSKFVTLKNIFIFSGNLFVSRGLKQLKTVPTSSLVFIAKKEEPKKGSVVDVINYIGKKDSISEIFNNIQKGKKIVKKRVSQKILLDNLLNWNFLKWDVTFTKLYEEYKRNTESIDVYREYDISQTRFGDIFHFDKGLVFPKNKIVDIKDMESDKDYYHLLKTEKNRYQASITDKAINKKHFRFPKGSQGMKVFDKKYKIVWRYMNPEKFCFTDKKVMFNFNYILISSNNKEEMLYLFALLNSSLIRLILNKLLRSETEKDLLLGIRTIKNYFRVPKINEKNQLIKKEIIKRAKELLNLEQLKLSDLVDFSGILTQKFDEVKVDKSFLLLIKNGSVIKRKIKANPDLVKEAIENEKSAKKISLSKLNNLKIINFGKQKELKAYMDNLVFALYFNLDLRKVVNNPEKVKNTCSKSKYYKIIKKAMS